MSFYKITFSLKPEEMSGSEKSVTVVREYLRLTLDQVWHILFTKCEAKWGRTLKNFDCVMISKRSPDYKKYISHKSDLTDSFGLLKVDMNSVNNKSPDIKTGSGKYRSGNS